MRRLSPELSPELLSSSNPDSVFGVFWAVPTVIQVPTKDHLLLAMSNSWWDLRITDEERFAVADSNFFSEVEYDILYKGRMDKNSGMVYDFLKIYRWGGDELVRALLVDRSYLISEVHTDNKLVELLESDWHMDETMSGNELSLLHSSIDGYLYNRNEKEPAPFTTAELVDAFLTDRAALARGYLKFRSSRAYNHNSWFHQAVAEVIAALRFISPEMNPLLLFAELEKEAWFDHKSTNIDHALVAEVANRMVLR